MADVLLVARDAAPSNAFKKLSAELAGHGVKSELFLGGGREIPLKNGLDAATFVERSRAVLVGMSSSPTLAKEEIVAAEVAVRFDTPVGCYADAFGAFNRPWFAHLRNKINFLFTLNEKEAESARKIFPNAKIIASGNPMWDEFFEPKLSREEARAKLSVADGRKVMFCIAPGKVLGANMGHFVNMVSAATRLSKDADRQWHLVFSLHPGDEDFDGHYIIDKKHKEKTGEVKYVNVENIYADIKKYSKMPITIQSRVLMETTHALSAADIVIDSGSTSGIEAVARNFPVIAFMTEVRWNRIQEQYGERGWPTIDQGCVPLTEDIGELANKIQAMLLFGEFENKFLPRQKECYPRPRETGVAIRVMAEAVMKFIV